MKIVPEGDVILTFGHSRGGGKTLIHAHSEAKKRFRVIVVDRVPSGGSSDVGKLVEAGNRLLIHPHELGRTRHEGSNQSILGAHGLFLTALYSPVSGTATIAFTFRRTPINR